MKPSPGKILRKLDVYAVLNGILGVAENGAIWIDNLKHRVIPFIAEHLILVLNEESFVKTMHEAYDKLRRVDRNQDLVASYQGPPRQPTSNNHWFMELMAQEH